MCDVVSSSDDEAAAIALAILERNASKVTATRRKAELKLTSMPGMAGSSFLSFMQVVNAGRRLDDS